MCTWTHVTLLQYGISDRENLVTLTEKIFFFAHKILQYRIICILSIHGSYNNDSFDDNSKMKIILHNWYHDLLFYCLKILNSSNLSFLQVSIFAWFYFKHIYGFSTFYVFTRHSLYEAHVDHEQSPLLFTTHRACAPEHTSLFDVLQPLPVGVGKHDESCVQVTIWKKKKKKTSTI